MDYRQYKLRRNKSRPLFGSVLSFTLPRWPKIALAGLGVIVAALVIFEVWSGIGRATELVLRGVTSAGQITGVEPHWTAPTRTQAASKTYKISYEFTTRGGEQRRGTTWLHEEEIALVPRDGRVDVRYLPDDPSLSGVVQFGRRDPFVLIMFCALLLVIAVGFLSVAWQSNPTRNHELEHSRKPERKRRGEPEPDSSLEI